MAAVSAGRVVAEGSAATVSAATPGQSSSAGEQVITAPSADAAIPVAFQESAASGKLSDAQKAQVDTLQQQFVNDIGGANRNPSNSDFPSAWQMAQEKNDQRYKILFGNEAFLVQQAQANRHLDGAAAQ
ncbi:MAG: hypothetical protein PHC88_12395 [Terrimicrobiaceae bacterium]|nr:hypothetical protein [Terrimicrobiaceae bacterium]